MKKIFIVIFPLILLLTIFAYVVYGNTFDMYRFFAHLSTIELPSFNSYITDFAEIFNSNSDIVEPLEILGAIAGGIKFLIDLLKVPIDMLVAIAKGLGY